jgi:AcrR family transcriptional regulator
MPKRLNPRGRPRDPSADRAILAATLALFIEHGIDATSIDQIARRAGVTRPTIYRRWASKEQLVARAIETARERVAPPTEMLEQIVARASPREITRRFLDFGAELWSRKEVRDMSVRLIGAKLDRPQLIAIYWKNYVEPRWRLFIAMLEQLRSKGLVHKRADVEVLAQMLVGAMMYRLLFMPTRAQWNRAQTRAYLERLLRQAGLNPQEVSK